MMSSRHGSSHHGIGEGPKALTYGKMKEEEM